MIRFRWSVVALAAVGLTAGCSSMSDRPPLFSRFRSYPVEGDCCSGTVMEGPVLGESGPPLPPPATLVPTPVAPLADQPPAPLPPVPQPLPPGAAPRIFPEPQQAQPVPAQPSSRVIIR
jgi:hypothetical protein